ncbi:hypothetical protein P154DRAFT_546977 [Amniculicola lignicola CBS 123094]|uniref:Extracellular membrane protein CFEM domain-containing protein n=1 Tax=Amniculicola lignicola CBS 123094 TaxID=1392246 RepID=A0A6A5WKA3_9PLEO|nr:hypothetical protein P154DRAFT_546977 [Amniculicola lignicola CBS 123094]
MYMFVALSVLAALPCLTIATPDPIITPIALLQPRQNVDPSVLGWVSSSGASVFSDLRSCDFPATLSRSGSFAQCCQVSSACNLWTTCSVGMLFAESTSVACDQGYCNTGVVVATTGAKSGESYLGCWATSLGKEPFTLVQDIGSAPIATPTPSSSSEKASGSGSQTDPSHSHDHPSEHVHVHTSGSATESETPTGSSTGAAASSSTGSAVKSNPQPLTGFFGLIAAVLAVL